MSIYRCQCGAEATHEITEIKSETKVVVHLFCAEHAPSDAIEAAWIQKIKEEDHADL